MIKNIPLTVFPTCADAGPEMKDHPGWRLCESQRLIRHDERGVHVDFCTNICPYRRMPEQPKLIVPWVTPAPLSPTGLRNLPCIHEGPIAVSCSRDDEGRHIRHCGFEGHEFAYCARSHPAPFMEGEAVQRCVDCAHYAAWPLATTRHLVYHVYPVSGNGAWQWNVAELCRRLPLFNGRIVVAVVTDPPSGRRPDPVGPHAPDGARHIAPCDTFDAVRASFGQWAESIEFLQLDNDPALREVRTLVPLLERVETADPSHVTLYAQAKGTTRHAGHVARRWAAVQYEVYLDHWPAVEEQLRVHPITGAFKKLGPGWSPAQSRSDWHYSGSWFWFRNSALFARDWRRADQFWSGIEPYPSQHFEAVEAGCLFHVDRVPRMNLYSPHYWDAVVSPALDRWRSEVHA